MSYHGHCPRCGKEISRDRFATGFAICSCGWSDPTPIEIAREKNEKRTVIAMFVATVSIMMFYAHLASWGPYALSIPFTKIQQFTGSLDKAGYHELADACISLNKWKCATDAYLGAYRTHGDPESVARLASFQSRLGDKAAALESYASYFRVGGKEAQPAVLYAKLLEEAGQTDEALKFYEVSMAASVDSLPVQATTGMIRLMIKKGQYEEAYSRLVAFHSSAGNAKGYLNTELAQLEDYLRKAGKKIAARR